jgi:hypothetical protein
MKRLARLAVVGTIALGSTMGAAAPLLLSRTAPLRRTRVSSTSGAAAVGGSSQPVEPLRAEPLGVLSLSPLLWIPAVLAVLLSW